MLGVCLVVQASITTEDWGFDDWRPHGLLVNLGTNDYCCGHVPTTAQYVDEMMALVRAVHNNYYRSNPPHIFIGCGPMTSVYCSDAQAAVNAAKNAGFSRVSFINFDGIATRGCINHPDFRDDVTMANRALPSVRSALGW